MKYILLCGGYYMENREETPKQLLEYGTGRTIIERTMGFLQDNGVTDIAISTNDPRFEWLGCPIIKRNYPVNAHWLDGLDHGIEACYIFGDVFFSPKAIKTIVETETDDIEFFASAPPFSEDYFKPWAEPFAFKVAKPMKFSSAINKCQGLADLGRFKRDPIAWELWQVIKDTPLNEIDYTNYHVINDYTTDIDSLEELREFRRRQRYDL